MQQEKNESLGDFSSGVNLALTVIFSVNRNVQIWSRVPGTTGGWFYGWMYFAGLAVQAWYYMANAQYLQRWDLVHFEFMARLSGIWFAVHGVARAIQLARGIRLHSYEPGVGVLQWALPNWPLWLVGLLSDLGVAIALSGGLWLLDSPIQSGWYAAMCVWLLLGHIWIHTRDARRRQIWHDSQIEADDWSQQIGRR